MSRAALVSAWGRRRHPAYAYVPGVVQAAPVTVVDGGDGGPIGLTVEIYLGDAGWEDITPFVYYRDRVRITRGKPDETSKIQPQSCQLTINNRDGRFSPRNPLSPYYGLIGRNTQLRVSRMQNGVRRYRFVGEVVSWPSTWDISGSDVYVQLQAAGMLRRLQQGTTLLQSAMRSEVPTEPSVLAYWPCEDGPQSLQFGTAFPGGQPMSINGTSNLASYSGFVASAPIPTLTTDRWYGVVTGSSTATDAEVKFLFNSPGLTDGARIISVNLGGGISRIDLKYRTGGLQLQVFAPGSSTAIADSGFVTVTAGIDNVPMQIAVSWAASGADTNVFFATLPVGATSFGLGLAIPSGVHAAGLRSVAIAPDGNLAGASIGHIYAQLGGALGSPALNAFNGQDALARWVLLAAQAGVDATYVDFGNGGIDDVTMGFQAVDTYGNLAQQVVDTDLGLMYEDREQLAVVYRTRLSLYNQGSSGSGPGHAHGIEHNPRSPLTLDYARNQLSGPLNPIDDDAYTRNDVTAQRISGSFARAVDTDPTDPLSTNAPPTGVGGYATSYSLSVGADAALTDHAHWRLHLGTVDEPRYPQLQLNLRHPEFTGNVDLLNQALTVDIGDLVVVNNPPPWMPPDPIRQILQGYSETLGVYEHDMVLNCSPASPYTVGILEDPVLSRADTDGSTLASALSAPLNSNAFFATGVSDWAANSCTVAQVGTSGSATPFPGGWPGYGALITANGGSAVGIMQPSASFRVSPNQTYNISVLVYYPSAAHTVELGIEWRDASNTLISTGSTFTTVPANTLTAISLSFTAPSTAVLADPVIGLGGTPANGDTLYATAVVVWQGSMTVASTNPLLPLWTTNPSAFPFDIACGGERLTVTGITGASSPQAFTVARAVNGVLKPQTPGTDVRLWQPTIVSL